jgi:hypothetical protein
MFAYLVKVAVGSVVFIVYFEMSYSIVQSLVTSLIFGGAAYTMARNDLREVFNVNKTIVGNALVLGVTAALLPFVFLYIN